VWVVENGLLRFRNVDVARIERHSVLLESGLQSGEQVVISSLKAVTDRMAIRTAPAKEDRS
jgi:hypothetical protein